MIGTIFEILRWRVYSKTRFKDKWYLCSRGIGDTVIFMSKLSTYKQLYPNDRIRLIISNSHESIAKCYLDCIDEYKVLPYKIMCRSSTLGFGNYLPRNIKYILPLDSIGLLGYKRLSISDLMNITLGLPENTINSAPIVDRKNNIDGLLLSIKGKDEYKKIALLAPEAVSVDCIREETWVELCKILKSYDYFIFINSSKKIEGLARYKHISYNLDETFYLADKCDLFVSVRSGLCDLIAFSKCPMLIIYPDDDSRCKFSMQEMGFRKHIKEVLENEIIGTLQRTIKENDR